MKRNPLAGGLAVIVAAVISTVLSATWATAASAAGPTPETWGNFGQLLGTTTLVSPTAITGVPGTITQLVTINSAVYVLTDTGSVYAWGADNAGQLGNGTVSTTSTLTPVKVQFPAGVNIHSLAPVGPRDTALALDTLGHAWGWGANTYGQLCLGDTSQYTLPVELPFAGVTSLAGAGRHASYDASGVVYSCGSNDVGQLGTGTFADSLTPKAVKGLPNEAVKDVTAAWSNEGVVMADGTFWNWGYNASGQLGNRQTTNSDVPVEVTLPAAVSAASEGGDGPYDGQTTVTLADGRIYGWGNDTFGQLCTRTAKGEQRAHPVRILPPSGVTWDVAVSGGGDTYYLDTKGRLWACGDNTFGQLGIGTKGGQQATPVNVPLPSPVTKISSTRFTVATAP